MNASRIAAFFSAAVLTLVVVTGIARYALPQAPQALEVAGASPSLRG